VVARILRKRNERKIEDVLGENRFVVRRVKGTRDAIGTVRIISERTSDIDGNCVRASETGRRHLTVLTGPN